MNVTGVNLAPSLLPNSSFETTALFVSAHATPMESSLLLFALFYAFLIPGVLSLYIALRGRGRATASVALAFSISGAVLGFMYISSAFAIIRMDQLFTSTASDALRSGFLAAALASGVAANVGNILSSLSIDGAVILAGYLMTRDKGFGKKVGYLGIFAGLVGIVSSFLPYPLLIAGSYLSLFGLVWIFVVGVRLMRLPASLAPD